jgi:hypothetical protein
MRKEKTDRAASATFASGGIVTTCTAVRIHRKTIGGFDLVLVVVGGIW